MKSYKEKHKKVVISGYYGFDNFGDEAILTVLTDKLKELKADITIFSSNPEKTERQHRVKSIKSFKLSQVIKSIKECNILFSGGGSLLQDVTSLKSLFYYLFIINVALHYKKQVVIFAQGIGPINNWFGRFLTKKTLKKCSIVTVRDDKSLFLLRGWGLKKVDLLCDPLFGLKLKGSMPMGKVGIQLRSFKTLSDKLLEKLADEIVRNFSDKELEIYSFQDSKDFDTCKQFEKLIQMRNPLIRTSVISGRTPKEIMDKISELEYMIAMRFHAILISLKYGIKTFAICYDEKVKKIATACHIPCVGMICEEDYGYLFKQLINLDKRSLITYSNSQEFDWSRFEKLFEL